MSLAVVYSRALTGMKAPLVSVEVHLSGGLPGMSIVGLPETAVKESKDRVRAALLNSRFEFPARRITINLAPAELPKEGGRFDLPIAIGILAASGQIPEPPLAQYEFLAELALDGSLRAGRGVLPAALAARGAGRALILPIDNAAEAALVSDVTVLGARHLLEVCAHLQAGSVISPCATTLPAATAAELPDLADVRGQPHARRALEVAAAGNHSLLMLGPPGSGKTLLALRLPGILPPMTEAEALESAALLSVSHHGFSPTHWRRRPFRAPHHTASGIALVGGGSQPRPGEVSLAHHGVLFLDELPEFDRRVLEVLREPLEAGAITISRAACQAEFPARLQLVAAMNPCPCGYLGDLNGRCRCSSEQVQRYRARISGPLLDRIDLHIEVPRLPAELMCVPSAANEDSATVRARVCATRARQLARAGKPNALLTNQEAERDCALTKEDHALLAQAVEKLRLSARAYHRILKIARTIADMEPVDQITTAHLSEAIGYRCLDRGV